MARDKIAVCAGGRDYQPARSTWREASEALADVALLVEGEATGFDSFLRDVALRDGIPVQPVPALWALAKLLGLPVRSEGHKRNARALRWARELAAEYKLELVLIAGPGGRGTADMRRRCDGLELREIVTGWRGERP